MPAATLKVEAESPVSVHGEIEDNPRPPPNAKSGNVTADAVTAPAAMLAHETAESASVKIALSERMAVSIGTPKWSCHAKRRRPVSRSAMTKGSVRRTEIRRDDAKENGN